MDKITLSFTKTEFRELKKAVDSMIFTEPIPENGELTPDQESSKAVKNLKKKFLTAGDK